MKLMKLSAIVLGLTATCTFAAPPAATVAATAPKKPVPVVDEAVPADTAKAVDAAVTEQAAEPAEAPAEQAAAPVEETVAAAPAEESAETPVAPVEETVAAAPAEEPAEAPAAPVVAKEESLIPEFKVSGEAELDAYALGYNYKRRFEHSFFTTLDLNFDIKFNDNWSAFVGVEAESEDVTTNPTVNFNGAYVQYQNDLLTAKVGDLTFSEGVFRYYRYDDATYYAAGMKEQNMRGLELDIIGIQAAIGLSADEETMTDVNPAAEDKYAFFAHLAYDWEIEGQKIRPYIDYKGYDLGESNRLRLGVDMNFAFLNLFDVHATYGFNDDYVMKAKPVVSHAFLIEPTITKGVFSLTGSLFYALLADNVERASKIDLPERFYIYAEPSIQFTDKFKVGVMGEYHTNTLDDENDKNEFAYVGPSVYFNPFNNLSMKLFGALILPLDDGDGTGTILNYRKNDSYLIDAGAEVVFNF